MTDFVQLIEWAFGGFWRFAGFALLVALVSGAAQNVLASLLIAIKAPSR